MKGSTPTRSSPRENTTSSPKEKTDYGVDINIENDVENGQALHIDNTSTGTKLYYGKSLFQWALLTGSSLMILVGACAGPLLGRLYFVHGGSRRWLYTWLQSAGWPMNLIPLCVSHAYKKRSGEDGDGGFLGMLKRTNLKLFGIYVAMAVLFVVDNLIFSWGLSYLPASTSALLLSSQLAFNALFSYLLVGQKMTASVLNSVFAITVAAVLLGLYAEGDRPPGTTQTQYIVGFILVVAAAGLYALILTLLEIIYKRVLKRANSVMVMEAQTIILAVATVMATVGMWAGGDFHAMRVEGANFDLGRGGYAVTLVGIAMGWEIYLLGAAGVLFVGSSLFTCVLTTAVLPIISFLAFIFFRDSFSALKAMSMLISMWGFVSYIYGGYSDSRSNQRSLEEQGLDEAKGKEEEESKN